MEAHAVPASRAPGRRLPVRHSLLSDEQLSRLVSRGDERAFATLYERYHQPLYRYCRSMLRHDADAQDALQSAMTGAYAALRRAQRDAPLRPWLFRIAHNESISVLRRRRPAAELTDELGGTAESVEDHGERRARLALLLADLKDLPERQRGALVMRELSGLSHGDIAIALGTSIGGAKQAIFEARRALSEFAEGRAMDCEAVCRLVSDADGRVLRGRRVRAHLRDCSSCAAFAAMIPDRRADLRALAPPLPALAAAGILSRVFGGSSAGGAGAGIGGGGAGFAGLITGKGVTLGLVTKALVGLAVLSGATVGITRAVEHASATPHHALPAGSTRSSDSRAASGHAAARRSGSVTLRTPAASRATGRSTHAAAFHTRGKSGSAPSAAVGRGVVMPPGQTVSSTVAPTGSSGATHGNSGSAPGSSGATHGNSGSASGSTGATHGNSGSALGSTVSSGKSTQGQTGSGQHSATPAVPTTNPRSTHASSTIPLGKALGQLAHLLG
jgi:RNA polymerase sigma factor (sigma-70 family)